MKKYMAFALALLLASTVFAGCRGTVSDDPGGIITDPTGTVEPTSPIPTMTIPATDPTELPRPTGRPSEPVPTHPATQPESVPGGPRSRY